MFFTPTQLSFFLYRHPTDMRKSFDGLTALVVNFIDKDPFSGNVFIFVNKRRDRIKLLLWDSDGFWIFYKRLERGTFQVPAINLSNDSLELSYEQLLMILKGFDLSDVKKRPRYKRTFC